MLTIPGRERMAEEARRCFYQQTYPHREIVTVNGPESIGVKRNRGVQVASGDIICHWDDDDISAPGRLAEQVERLLANDVDIVGYHSILFANFGTGEAWRYDAQRGPHAETGYAVGSSFMYRKSFWEGRRFLDTNVGEDNAFLYGDMQHGRPRARVHSIDGERYLLARQHEGNTDKARESIIRVNRNNWQPVEWERVRKFQEEMCG